MFDFQNAQTPQLTPLRYSFAVDDIENELRNLFIDLFDAYLGSDAFDVNVLGMAHLGTLDLVRKSVNADGLVLLPGDREEPATRYVYRAWKSRNKQGRGLYFLRTYLQALFPGAWGVQQQMQLNAQPYPTALTDRSIAENDADKYLTSRLHIKFDATEVADVSSLQPVISAILPARFIPKLIVVLYTETQLRIDAVGNPSITLRATSNVTAPDLAAFSAGEVVVARANIAITLQGQSTVSR